LKFCCFMLVLVLPFQMKILTYFGKNFFNMQITIIFWLIILTLKLQSFVITHQSQPKIILICRSEWNPSCIDIDNNVHNVIKLLYLPSLYKPILWIIKRRFYLFDHLVTLPHCQPIFLDNKMLHWMLLLFLIQLSHWFQ
jgi:hypothetical protein